MDFTPEQIFKLLKLKLNPYEKVFYSPRKSVYANNLKRSVPCKENGYEFRKILLPEIYYDFRKTYSPFCEFSRATPIGSIYASRHLSEFKEGIFNRPLLQTNGYVVPSYFRNKADQSVFGLRALRKGIKSDSFNLGNLADLRRRLSESLATGAPLREYIPFEPPIQVINDTLQRPGMFFLDKRTKERIIFFNDHAQYYKYSRKSRSYQFTHAIPVADWIRLSLLQLEQNFADYEKRKRISQENIRSADAANLMLLDYGDDLSDLKNRYIERQKSVIEQKQKEYDQLKLFVE